MEKRFRFKVGQEELAGFILSNNHKKPGFVFLHGAGTGNKERIEGYKNDLVAAGLSLLAFDFSGHGESTGKLSESSLEKRTTESRAIIEKFADIDNLTIVSSSMGADHALRMLQYFNVKNLILFCPGIYDRKAYPIRFDNGFTEMIREKDSWKNTDVLENLKNFKGKLLLIIGGKDNVIPKGVLDLIENSSMAASKKETLIIPEAPHKIHHWLAENSKYKQLVTHKLIEYSH